MPSQTKENYLKAMLFLADEKGHFTLTELSKKLGVSTPTANNMVKKLQDQGWVVYEKYKPLKLTRKGSRAAASILRKHRLTEMYLTEIMGFGWEEVHDIAEQIEHISADKLFDRMDQLLGFPTVDPHGSPIPDKHGNIKEREYIKLSELAVGQKAQLCAVEDSSHELLVLLNEKQIKLGTKFFIRSLQTFDQSMIVDYDECYGEVLSKEVTSRLMVEKL